VQLFLVSGAGDPRVYVWEVNSERLNLASNQQVLPQQEGKYLDIDYT
jgi:hypothetical protein